MFGLFWGPMGQVVATGASQIRSKAASLGILNHYWLFGLFVALVHSLIEEYYWRWFVYGRLRELVRPGSAHALAALAFAAHHIVITTQYFGAAWGLVLGSLVGVGGALWSVMYERQRTLAGAWASHMAVDLGILAVGHKAVFGTYI
jgi:membrane protease YdiL (CAAX protease family)